MGDKPFSPPPLTDLPLSEQKKARILEVLEQNGGNVNKASVVLGISASSLIRRIDSWREQPVRTTSPTSNSTTRRFYESLKTPWSVTSFNVRTREACIEIRAASGTVRLSYTAPSYKMPE